MDTVYQEEHGTHGSGGRELMARDSLSDDIMVSGIGRSNGQNSRGTGGERGEASTGSGGPATVSKKVEPFGFDGGAEEGDPFAEGDAPEAARNTVNAMLNAVIPYGGMLSTGFNLASTSVGAGVLGLPAAFNSAGTLMAVIYLVGITAETVYSMRLLALVAQRTGLKNFEEMGAYLMHPGVGVFIGVLRVVSTYCGMVAYVVTIGDLLQPVLAAISGTPPFLLTPVGRKLLQAGLWFVFMFPLSFVRRFNSLRYISAFGMLFIVYLGAVIIAHSCMHGLKAEPRAETKLFNTGNEALAAFSNIAFSYLTQIASTELYLETRPRSLRRFTLCSTVTMSICGVLYLLIGLFGYLDFGTEVRGSILLHYNPIEQPQVFVAYIGIFAKICASFGLLNNACRCALFPLLRLEEATMPVWKHSLIVTAVSLGTLALGVLVPNVTIVLSLTGALGSWIGFIFPALYIMYAGNWTLKSVGLANYVSTYLTLIAGVVVCITGFGSAFYGVATTQY